MKVFLEAGFGALPHDLSLSLAALSAEQLGVLLPLAATDSSLEEFTARIVDKRFETLDGSR